MTTKEHFNQCRERLWALLHDVDFSDGCKSYEGLIEVIQTYPEYFSSPDKLPEPESTIIKLHCYVLGDSRHYEFKGNTFPQAIMKFDKWLSKIEEDEKLKTAMADCLSSMLGYEIKPMVSDLKTKQAVAYSSQKKVGE